VTHASPSPTSLSNYFLRRANATADEITVTRQQLNPRELQWSRQIHEFLTAEFHTNSHDASFRGFLVDHEGFQALIQQAASQALWTPLVLSMCLFIPNIDRGIFY
jgi:hypothetical protein